MTKTLVVFYSKHGYTQNLAKQATKITNGDYLNLAKEKDTDISEYDKIIIGSGIYAGSASRKIKKFINNHIDELLQKKIALFICCVDENEAENQFNKSFPDNLRKHAYLKALLGGEIRMKKLGFFEKLIIQSINKTKKDILNHKQDAIQKFLKAIQK